MNTGSLQEVQALLDKSGVRDVKFFFNKEFRINILYSKILIFKIFAEIFIERINIRKNKHKCII